MSRKLFVNLPVKDLEKTKAFFAALGFTFNPQFTNESAACMVVSEHNFVMLLMQPFFQGFTPKPLADAHASTEVLVAFDCDSKAAVDELVGKALAAGAKEPREPQDHGFMYQRTFEDLDGHMWEPFWFDPAALQQG